MSILSKRLLFAMFLAFLLGITNSYSQSENKKVADLIDQKKDFNKKYKNSVVYKIQLYNGNEEQAYKIKRNFNMAFPEYKTTIMYKPPEWKTQVGNFKTRLEADKVLQIIRKKFFGAIVLEDKI